MEKTFLDLSFGEKIKHKMLHDKRSLLSVLADKAAVKDLVFRLIGDEYVVPNYSVFENESELDFTAYPRQFVLKPTHGSQAGILVHEQYERYQKQLLPIYQTWGSYFKIHPADLDRNIGFFKVMARRWLNSQYRPDAEFCYKAIPPKVIVEKYIEAIPKNTLNDFRFYTFHGQVKFFRAATGPTNDIANYAYDENGIFLPIRATHDEVEYNEKYLPELPRQWSKMKELAEKLSMGIDFVRIDFILSDAQVYFSEFTNYPMAGHIAFLPESFDKIVSSWWRKFDCC